MTQRTEVNPDAVRRSARLRSWWKDGLEAAIWLACAGAVAFFIASGGLLTAQPVDHVYSAGRIAGLIAAVLVMTQVLLVSRAPWLERAVGHDRTTHLHTTLGKVAFILMMAHVGLVTIMTAYYDNHSVLEQGLVFAQLGWFMIAAQVGFGVFALVVATSLALVRSRWRYETWYVVHVFVYVAIALVVPHQFLEGTTFRTHEVAFWYWMALYALSFGSLVIYRFIRPLWRLYRHNLRVSAVEVLPDGSRSIVMTGRNLARWKARAGQFFMWRFLDRERWTFAHPFSLSAAPTNSQLRITVKPSGDFTTDIGGLRPGTRVMADGPLGVFSHVTRTQPGIVMLGAGIGVTPIRSMLDELAPGEQCTVIVRMNNEDDAPLLEEIREAAQAKGAVLHVMFGTRHDGWKPQGFPVTLSDLAPHVAESDVYICGPVAWAELVEQEALASGCTTEAIHREEFAW